MLKEPYYLVSHWKGNNNSKSRKMICKQWKKKKKANFLLILPILSQIMRLSLAKMKNKKGVNSAYLKRKSLCWHPSLEVMFNIFSLERVNWTYYTVV